MHWNSQAITTAFADAALNSSRWTSALDKIAEETGSVGAFLLPIAGITPNLPHSKSLEEPLDVYFRDGWHLRDKRFRVLPKLVELGAADDFDWTTAESMSRDPYFQEFLRPVGLQYFGGVKIAAGDDLWIVSIQRSPQQGAFSPEQKSGLAWLSSRLAAAVAVARALGFAAASAAAEAFEFSGAAVALLNRRGEVTQMNRAAESLLGSEIYIHGKRLISWNRQASLKLEGAIHALFWAQGSSALAPPVVLPRRERRPILAYPLKMSAFAANAFSDCQAMLVFVDLERRVRPPLDDLRSSFGLTAAEARLAADMAGGTLLEVAADALGISKETARNELKSVFQKTGVHRQSELVSLLATFLNRR